MLQGTFIWKFLEFENIQNLFLFLELLNASNMADTKQTRKSKHTQHWLMHCKDSMDGVTLLRRENRSIWLTSRQWLTREGLCKTGRWGASWDENAGGLGVAGAPAAWVWLCPGSSTDTTCSGHASMPDVLARQGESSSSVISAKLNFCWND